MASWTEQLPSGNYRAVYTIPNGERRYAKPTKGRSFTTERLAMKAAIEGEADAASLGWRDPRAAGKTWGEWCAAWWDTRPVAPGTLQRDVSPRDKWLMPKWGDVPIGEINRQDVKAWATELRREGLAPTSVSRHIHLFSGSLTAAIDAGIISVNPTIRLKLPNGETDEMRFLSKEEAMVLLDACEVDVKPFVALLLLTGLRWGEAAGLQWKRVDAERGMIRVAEVWDDKTSSLKAFPKGRRMRDIPIDPAFVGELDLFDGPQNGLVFGKLNYANWRNRSWLPALERSKLGALRPHDLRHTYASWQIQSGTSIYKLGALLGHVSPITTQRYAHLAESDNSAVLAAVSGIGSWGKRGETSR